MSATRRGWTLVTLALLFVSQTLWAKSSITPVFYQVHYQGKTAWLLGSFHVGKRAYYPLPDKIQRAYDQAGALVLEVDSRKPDMSALVQKYGMQPQTPDTATQTVLNQYCKKRAAVCQQMASFSPWFQATQISLLRLTQLGYSGQYGIESQLTQQLGKRPLLALETAESQLAMLASISLPTQWAMLRDAISAPDSDMQMLIAAWQTGDAKALTQLTEDELRAQGGEALLKTMLWDRNHVMADGIVRYLKSADKPLFVAVGAGHLVGQHSVITLLEKLGASSTDCQHQRCQY